MKDMDFFDFSNGKVMLNITNKCNVLCAMCSGVREKEKNSLDRKEVFKVAQFAKDHNVAIMEITGGEPLLMEYIYDLLQYLCESRLRYVQLITNGTTVSNKGMERLKGYKNLHMVFSIHGIEKTHDNIVKQKGAFEKADRNIRMIASMGINVAINSVIQKDNFHELFDIYRHFSDLKYDWHAFTPADPRFPILPETVSIPEGHYKKLKKDMKRTLESAKKLDRFIVLSENMFFNTRKKINGVTTTNILHPGFMCTVPRRLVIVYNSGVVIPCYHHDNAWKKYPMDLNIKSYSRVDDLVFSEAYKKMILKETGIYGCQGCNTLCYLWDPDFTRKIVNPVFADKILPGIVDFLKTDKNTGVTKSCFDGLNAIPSGSADGPIYVWGTGIGGEYTFEILKDMGVNVAGFIDNDKNKWAKKFCGLKIFPPKKIKVSLKEKRPFIVIGSTFVQEISSQLKEMGYKENLNFQINEKLV